MTVDDEDEFEEYDDEENAITEQNIEYNGAPFKLVLSVHQNKHDKSWSYLFLPDPSKFKVFQTKLFQNNMCNIMLSSLKSMYPEKYKDVEFEDDNETDMILRFFEENNIPSNIRLLHLKYDMIQRFMSKEKEEELYGLFTYDVHVGLLISDYTSIWHKLTVEEFMSIPEENRSAIIPICAIRWNYWLNDEYTECISVIRVYYDAIIAPLKVVKDGTIILFPVKAGSIEDFMSREDRRFTGWR